MLIIGGIPEDWGIIPSFLNEDDTRSAKEQIDSHYVGGWNSFEGFTLDAQNMQLKYTGDPPLKPLSAMSFRDEMLFMYEYAWVLIMQKDGSYDVARLD
jgi:hypothetical protein